MSFTKGNYDTRLTTIAFLKNKKNKENVQKQIALNLFSYEHGVIFLLLKFSAGLNDKTHKVVCALKSIFTSKSAAIVTFDAVFTLHIFQSRVYRAVTPSVFMRTQDK